MPSALGGKGSNILNISRLLSFFFFFCMKHCLKDRKTLNTEKNFRWIFWRIFWKRLIRNWKIWKSNFIFLLYLRTNSGLTSFPTPWTVTSSPFCLTNFLLPTSSADPFLFPPLPLLKHIFIPGYYPFIKSYKVGEYDGQPGRFYRFKSRSRKDLHNLVNNLPNCLKKRHKICEE